MIPEISKITTGEITTQLKKRAAAYTPEWRFDRENPDGGTALAVIFGELFADTIKKYNQLPRKHMIEFFNCAGTSLNTSQPARGYVVFRLVNQDVEGTEVRKGTGLLAEGGNEGQPDISFETQNDLFVTPVSIQEMVQVLPDLDGIYSVYRKEDDSSAGRPGRFRLFEEIGENLQEHVLYLAHEHVFYLKKAGCITLWLHPVKGKRITQEQISCFADPSCVQFEYSTSEGFTLFDHVEVDRHSIKLYKQDGQPASGEHEYSGRNTFWIRIRCINIKKMGMTMVSGISLTADCRRLLPDTVIAGGLEQTDGEFLPFGEQMGVYQEVYFASDQVLSQKKSAITLSFRLNFMKIPSETFGQGQQIDWKLVMKRSEFIPDPEYDIGINEVVWEYYNGSDWRKLPESGQYKRIFCADQGLLGQKAELTFQCPTDLEPVLVQSLRSCYIRARVLKMNNLYRLNGQYITPVLSDVGFTYEYRDYFPSPDLLIARNNLDTRSIKGGGLEAGFPLFIPLQEKYQSIYLRFDRPIDKGPVRLLFQLREMEKKTGIPLRYEFYSKSGWQPLNLIDGTHGLQRTGIITVLDNPGFGFSDFKGKKQCWIRIEALSQTGSSEKEMVIWPEIEAIEMNATEIIAVETREPERFRIEPNEKDASFKLTAGNIYEASVWVKEKQKGTDSQIEKLREQYPVMVKETEYGADREIWIQWKEVESFALSGPQDCHYIIDKNEGIIRFSDGIHGKIPDSGLEESIYVEYKCGGGSDGNVETGRVKKLRSSVGFINAVSNPCPTAGGTDREDVGHAVNRKSQALRHRNRAITAADYEALALESDGSIIKAKCYPNCGLNGEPADGQAVLVLMIEKHLQNHIYFKEVKKRCLSYLENKIPAVLTGDRRLHVIEPSFVELSVRAVLRVREVNKILETRQRAHESLEQFMDPVCGNFKGRGFDIGEIPNQIQLRNLLRNIQGVEMVESIRLLPFVWKNGQKQEIDLQDAARLKFSAAAGGVHQISILDGGDGD